MANGTLYIVSAPSGAGKTSLVKRLIADTCNLVLSVSHTTRAIRPGEAHGRDYFFVTPAEFERLIHTDELLEHAKVFDHYYGTAKETVTRSLADGKDVILEIDWQGAQQIRMLCPECLSIFILPPSIAILEQRLRNRGQDDENVIARRMRDAVTEIRHYAEYDYILVNDDFEKACQELKSIVDANRLKVNKQRIQLGTLLSQLTG